MPIEHVSRVRFILRFVLGICAAAAAGCAGADATTSGASPQVTASADAADAADEPLILPVGSPEPQGAQGSGAPDAAADAPGDDAGGCEPCDGGCAAGQLQVCGVACPAGYTSCGGSCVTTPSLDTDPRNCGSCGDDCLGGACMASTCQSWPVSQDNSILIPGGDPSGDRAAIASDGASLVWLTRTAEVFEAPVAGGGAPVVLAAPPSASATPGSIAIAGGVVVWTVADPAAGISVWEARSNAPGSAKLLNQLGATSETPCGLALNAAATTAYFLAESSSDAQLYELTLGANPLFTVLAASPASTATPPFDDIAVAADYLFWTESSTGKVDRYSFADGSTSQVAIGQSTPFRLAVDATDVYWANAGAGSTFTIAWTSQGSPSTPTLTPAQPGYLTGLAADGTSVYFTSALASNGTTRTSQIQVEGLAGGAPSAFLSGDQDLLFGTVLGGGGLFWLDASNGTLFGQKLR